MKKLHIGQKITQLDGRVQRYNEGGVERDMTIRDVIVQLIPMLPGIKSDKALLLWDVGLKIRNCKDEWIDLENHDFDELKAALEAADALVWVRAALAQAFKETETE